MFVSLTFVAKFKLNADEMLLIRMKVIVITCIVFLFCLSVASLILHFSWYNNLMYSIAYNDNTLSYALLNVKLAKNIVQETLQI